MDYTSCTNCGKEFDPAMMAAFQKYEFISCSSTHIMGKRYWEEVINGKKRRKTMKKVKYNETSIDQLPNDKPVLYRIETETGNLNYTGVAKRGRVRDRIKEHLGEIPGANVNIEQFSSINDARNKEKNVIKRNQPKYNEQDK